MAEDSVRAQAEIIEKPQEEAAAKRQEESEIEANPQETAAAAERQEESEHREESGHSRDIQEDRRDIQQSAIMAVNFPAPQPMELNDKGKTYDNWRFFDQQFRAYILACGLEITKDEDKPKAVAYLNACVGKDCFLALKNLPMTEDERKDPVKVLDALEKHFKPQKNEIYERFLFNSATQTSGFEDFLATLRRLVETCGYPEQEKMIRDRIVIGTSDQGARARMLRKADLTLTDAINICRTSEITEQQLKAIGGTREAEESVHYAKQKSFNKKKPSTSAKEGQQNEQQTWRRCKYCGINHKWVKDLCPAWGKRCKKCSKMNHFASECKSSPAVNYVEEEDEDEEIYTLQEESLYKVGKGKQWFTMLHVQTKDNQKSTLRCQIDPGATCNVISKKELGKHFKNLTLDQSKSRISVYGGGKITPIGEVIMMAEGKKVKFLVTETADNTLIGARASEALGLVTRNPEKVEVLMARHEEVDTREALLGEYKEVFKGLGKLEGPYHIEVDKSVRPTQQHPRRIPIGVKQEVIEKLEEMEKQGIIKKVTCHTDWISNMVIVKKPSKLRVCIDPSDLNPALLRPNYQTPTIEDILPKLSKAKVFSVLDAKDGFWQVELDEESSLLTTFWTPKGRYRWCRMPFGISTAPEEFQRRLHETLDGVHGIEVIADDILITGSGNTQQEAENDHDRNLRALLERAKEKNLKLNYKKRKIGLPEVKYIGHIISSEGLKPDPDKLKAIAEMPEPADAKSVQRFLGVVGYLSKFIQGLSDTAEPLRRLTDDGAEWIWEEPQRKAFKKLKEKLLTPPTLAYFDETKNITVQADASQYGLGAVLSQEGKPVVFASRALTATEKNYAQIEKECLAIVFAAEKFDTYLYGKQHILVESDHKPLETIFKKSILTAPKRLQRMLLRLQRYRLNVKFKQGSEMYIADCLSRDGQGLITKDPFQQELEQICMLEHLKVSKDRVDQIRKHTTRDTSLLTLQDVVLAGWPETREETPASIRQYWNHRDEITLQDGIIFKGNKIIIPASMRREMVIKTHETHLGIEACLRRARDTIYWPGMNAEIKEAVQNCTVCAEHMPQNRKEPLMTHEYPKRPWGKIAADLCTHKQDHYVVIVDYYSDYIEMEPVDNTMAGTIIEVFKRTFARHGIPEIVHTDNGPPFDSQEMRRFAQEWEFELTSSSPGNSRSNGKAEAAVKIIKGFLKKSPDKWKALLNWRNTPTEGLGSSPVQRLMSRRTKTGLPITDQALLPEVIDLQTTVEKKEIEKRKEKWYHDRSAKTLPELEYGTPVRVQMTSGEQRRGITIGTPRSYRVQVGNNTLRRNRRSLRPLPRDPEEGPEPPALQMEDQMEPNVSRPETPIATQGTHTKETQPNVSRPETPTATRRTRTREIQPPVRFQDYITQ
jgi:hypothetical protein